MSKSTGGRAAVLSILVGGLGVGTLAYYVKTTPQASHVARELRAQKPGKTVEAVEMASAQEAKPRRRTTRATSVQDPLTVRLPAFGDDIEDMDLGKDEVAVPGGTTAMRFVAQRVAEAAHFDGARVEGVEVREHVAVVKYNAVVARGMGSMEEGAFLRALQVGFGQFEDVDRISIESDGKPLESGHIDLTNPLPVIRPGQDAPAAEDSKPSEP